MIHKNNDITANKFSPLVFFQPFLTFCRVDLLVPVETLKDGGEWLERWCFKKYVVDWLNIEYFAIKNVKLQIKRQFIHWIQTSYIFTLV